jgi:Scavenger mRNA decapping enzyme C-term binding
VLAFKDINPAAPVHVLVIPKERNALTRIDKATEEHTEILGRLMVRAINLLCTFVGVWNISRANAYLISLDFTGRCCCNFSRQIVGLWRWFQDRY